MVSYLLKSASLLYTNGERHVGTSYSSSPNDLEKLLLKIHMWEMGMTCLESPVSFSTNC